MADVYQGYRDRLAALVAKRDSVKESIADVQAELDSVNYQIEALRQRQAELVEKKQAALGGQAWLDLKKEIAALSKLLSGK